MFSVKNLNQRRLKIDWALHSYNCCFGLRFAIEVLLGRRQNFSNPTFLITKWHRSTGTTWQSQSLTIELLKLDEVKEIIVNEVLVRYLNTISSITSTMLFLENTGWFLSKLHHGKCQKGLRENIGQAFRFGMQHHVKCDKFPMMR